MNEESKIPTTLKHKPVIVVENYAEIDTSEPGAESHAKGLSLGLAQWSDRGVVDVSAKVWRHTGEKWSRMSEEMPLHRVLDLAILICRAKMFFSQDFRPGKYTAETPQIDRIGMQGSAMNVALCADNPMLETDMDLFRNAWGRDDERLSERMHILGRLLQEMDFTPNP